MSTQPNDGGFAFPFTPTDRSGQIGPTEPGMSLRAYFAGQVIQGLYASGDLNFEDNSAHVIKGRGMVAVAQADALIAELNKTQQ